MSTLIHSQSLAEAVQLKGHRVVRDGLLDQPRRVIATAPAEIKVGVLGRQFNGPGEIMDGPGIVLDPLVAGAPVLVGQAALLSVQGLAQGLDGLLEMALHGLAETQVGQRGRRACQVEFVLELGCGLVVFLHFAVEQA
jgi:hypothetical protein